MRSASIIISRLLQLFTTVLAAQVLFPRTLCFSAWTIFSSNWTTTIRRVVSMVCSVFSFRVFVSYLYRSLCVIVLFHDMCICVAVVAARCTVRTSETSRYRLRHTFSLQLHIVLCAFASSRRPIFGFAYKFTHYVYCMHFRPVLTCSLSLYIESSGIRALMAAQFVLVFFFSCYSILFHIVLLLRGAAWTILCYSFIHTNVFCS